MALYDLNEAAAREAIEFGGTCGFADEPAEGYQPTAADLDEMEQVHDGWAFDRIIERLWDAANAEADACGPLMVGESRRVFVERFIAKSLELRARDAVGRRRQG